MAGEKTTKYCELSVTLLNGASVTGRFHVESRTTSTIRPSDAVRESKNGFLLLTDATYTSSGEPRDINALMIPLPAVAFIELPSTRWVSAPPLRRASVEV